MRTWKRSISTIFPAILLAIGVVCDQAKSDIITENTAGIDVNTFFPGNSLTTPSGGPWSDIIFHWFSDAPGTNPTAFGTLFLLDQEYLGTPNVLSPATSGFLAQSIGISGGMYFFDPGVIVQPDTQYFFYANASGLISGNNDVPGESVYFTFDSATPFVANSNDANYRLSGLAIPEPSSLLLLVAIGLTTLTLRRRKQ